MKIKKKRILIIVAHTDDESFGCGGLIKKLSKHNLIGAISFTNGISSRKNYTDSDIKKRKLSSLNASKILGFKWISQYNYPDNQLDKASLLEIIKLIEQNKKKFNPHIVLTHNFSDLNVDHRKVAEATLTAFRPEPKEILEQLLTFEIPSATDFRILKSKRIFLPNFFVNVEKTIKSKIKAIKCYNNEIKPAPHSRSIFGVKNLSKFRGNQSGLKFAEAFEIVRKIEKK
tara:strand:- start:65 stop:751 length:687 start_codon:yes stop_codon:yes gene_type:complete